MQGKCITNKATPTRTTHFSKEKGDALGGTQTHDTAYQAERFSYRAIPGQHVEYVTCASALCMREKQSRIDVAWVGRGLSPGGPSPKSAPDVTVQRNGDPNPRPIRRLML